jgi:single-stranded DNA-specific DHH superfamily exonuclease
MSQDFGRERPAAHAQTAHREPARWLVLIEAGGVAVARLFVASREPVAEFDAAVEEVAQMIRGLQPERGAEAADAPAWDRALAGHGTAERAAALVYRLDV